MRVALIGAGGIAAVHLGNLLAIDGVEVVGVAARSVERARPLAERAGARAYAAVDELCDRERPEAAFVCVLPAAHGAIERALIARRIPFLVEKPLSIDWDTAAAIGRQVAESGLITSVGYHWRYHSTIDRVRAALAGRRPALVQGYYLTRTPAPAWWSRQRESGGQLVEQLTHIIDLARYLVGEAETVSAATARVERASHPSQDVEQVTSLLVQFHGGAVGTFGSTCLLNATHRVGLHIFAEGLAVEIGLHGVTIDDGSEKIELRVDGEAMAREARAFVTAVEQRDPDGIRSSYADALRTHRLTTRAVESAQRREVLMVG